MKKIIRLTEYDLRRIVKRTINEMEDEDFMRGADRNWEDGMDDDPRFYSPSPDDEEDDDPRFYAPSPDDDDEFHYDDKFDKESQEIERIERDIRGPQVDNENDDDDYFDDDEEWGETDLGEETLQDLIEDARDILENELGFSIDAINELDEFDIVEALRDHGYDDEANDIEYLMEKEGYYNVDDEEYEDEEDHEEELDETWDDFTQKNRHPKGYKPERYQRIPKDYFKNPLKLDPEGTIAFPKKEEPFDDYEDFDEGDYV